MSEHNVIGIELTTLRELIGEVVREEMMRTVNRFKEQPATSDDDVLFTKDIAKLLNITRQTVFEYRKKEILPPPQFTPGGRAYWTRGQVTTSISNSTVGYKYQLLPSQTGEQIASVKQNEQLCAQ